jgi:geranylgeranyl pyrophosphate synthase
MSYTQSLLNQAGASSPSVARTAVQAEADLTALIGELRAHPDVADQATAEFLERITGQAMSRGSGKTMSIMVRLPLLVHGAETGDPGPAKLISIVHILWWAAARFLDDLADSAASGPADPVLTNKGILAAMVAGNYLPARLMGAADVDPVTMTRLHAEFSRGWTDAISGQLLDFDAEPASATPESVLLSYRGKTGAPYAMACAMAAALAGADARRTDRWRELGGKFGVLRQLVNDQLDLVSGRDEDLANGTATYLLAYFLQSLTAARKEEILALHSAAATCPDAREKLRDALLAPSVAGGYVESVTAMVREAHATVDDLGGEQPFAAELHALLGEAMGQARPPFVLTAGEFDHGARPT